MSRGARNDALAPWRGHARFDASGLAPPVVVACSGGPDSVALLALACDADLDPVAVHVDHGLRAEHADDAALVQEVAGQLGARFVLAPVLVEPGGNLEARARDARAEALRRARVDTRSSVVLLGHTQDDQAETVLLNLMRGAAGSGLAGMAYQRDEFVRPLLAMRRSDTHAICAALHLPVARDAMNDDPAFRRVAVRRDVLPLLTDVAGRDLVPVLARQADIMREESAFLDELAVAAWPDSTTSARALRELPPVLAQRAVRRWLGPPPPSRAEVARVLEVAHGSVRATELAGGRVVRRSGGQLLVEPR
ncbi:MAG TPA: tRNA lysidine(34) synthetase TilS [Acidimicrobiia bacterium]|nr:tRNA lysidine(34) synthetase TilS [Acidimicrobiia bacterium]